MMDSRLKRWLHILAGVACAAASIACALVGWQGTETITGFRADAEVKDVGVLKQQEERDVVFRLFNATEAPVEIVQVSTSCTCTRAAVAARNLRPGESTELTARLSAGTRRGQMNALVNVLYRVGKAQSVERLPLRISATVEPHYTVVPEDIVFEQGRDGKKDTGQEANVIIVPNSGSPVRILKAYSTHPAVQVEMITRDTVDTVTGGTTIHLIFDPTRCIAPSVKAEIIVQTDSKMEPIHRVPVRVVSKRVD
jgi:hypothetical protein